MPLVHVVLTSSGKVTLNSEIKDDYFLAGGDPFKIVVVMGHELSCLQKYKNTYLS